MPSVNAFICMRWFASAMFVYLDFLELIARRELPLVVRGHRDGKRLQQITNNVAAWHNDLFSIDKELAHGDVHNLVLVLAREKGIDLALGKHLAIAYCNKEVATFETLRTQLPSFGTELDIELHGYIDAPAAMIRGNLEWSLDTVRYKHGVARGSESVGAETDQNCVA